MLKSCYFSRGTFSLINESQWETIESIILIEYEY